MSSWSATAPPDTSTNVIDRVAFGLPDLVLADTEAHASYYAAALDVPPEKLAVVPVGALPLPGVDGAARELAPGEPLHVVQYGRWSPLHGLSIVLEAADELRDEPFRFELIGDGQLERWLADEVWRLQLEAVDLVEAMPAWRLRARIVESDVCLGVFGTSGKAARVLPNKVYDALAAGRPLVTEDSPAARELLEDGRDALLVPAGDGRRAGRRPEAPARSRRARPAGCRGPRSVPRAVHARSGRGDLAGGARGQPVSQPGSVGSPRRVAASEVDR